MTFEQMAIATRSDPAWLHNASRLIGRRLHRTPNGARWWALVRVLSHELGLSLKRAAEAADAVLRPGVAPNRIRLAATKDGSAALQIDLERFFSTANASLSAAYRLGGPRRRGRPTSVIVQQSRSKPTQHNLELVLRDVSAVLVGLADGGASFVGAGDIACAVHGSTRAASHARICITTAPEALVVVARLLKEWDAYPRGIEPGLPFIMDANTLTAVPLLALTTSRGAVDVVKEFPGVGAFGEAWAHSIEAEAFGVRFNVLAFDALLATLRATGRPDDHDRLIDLRAIRSPAGAE